MVTQNFKQLLASTLQISTTVCTSGLRMQDVSGYMRYASCCHYNNTSFPSNRVDTYTLGHFDAGVSIGRGDTPATEYDWNLEDTITSGVLIQKISHVPGMDSDGCPYLRYTFTITNTDTETLVIREVGYKQHIRACATPGREDDSGYVFLLDRTILEDPLIIEPGDAGVLVYTLKTIPRQAKTIGDVKVVGFDWGTDEEIADILDAARLGRVDLQTDIGWRVGDKRKIHIEPFTDGANVTHAAQDIDIVISSFEEYNECGNVMQFDFLEAIATGVRMNPTNTYAGGYGESEMKKETLPQLATALPAWLRGRLKTFDVVVAKSDGTTEVVSGNKLALRSEMEIFGFLVCAYTPEGEHVKYYKDSYNSHIKRRGYSGSNYFWVFRTMFNHVPNTNTYYNVCGATSDSVNSSYRVYSWAPANDILSVAPFGCI